MKRHDTHVPRSLVFAFPPRVHRNEILDELVLLLREVLGRLDGPLDFARHEEARQQCQDAVGRGTGGGRRGEEIS